MNSNFLKTKAEITAWLDEYEVKNYNIIPDDQYGFVVNVEESVILVNRNLTFLPVKFNKISKGFDISRNFLTSLEGCPNVVNSSFLANNNLLTNLVGGPEFVGEHYNCSHNQLTSLQGAPSEVVGNFHCSSNELTSLEHAPVNVGNSFFSGHNRLTDLQGVPKRIGLNFYSIHNPLENLLFFPDSVGGLVLFKKSKLGAIERECEFAPLHEYHLAQVRADKEKKVLEQALASSEATIPSLPLAVSQAHKLGFKI